jgi:hypothetical protein
MATDLFNTHASLQRMIPLPPLAIRVRTEHGRVILVDYESEDTSRARCDPSNSATTSDVGLTSPKDL